MKWLGWYFDVLFIPLLLIALCLGILFHFALIAIYGGVIIREPNRLILWTEVAFISGVIVYCVVWIRKRTWTMP